MTTTTTTFDTLASAESVTKTQKALEANNFHSEVVETGAEALERIKARIPKGVSVMNGSSRTLDEIGFIAYLKSGAHAWNNLHEKIVAETDKAKQMKLRHEALSADYYLGSVHALSETGELVVASNSGSQLPYLAFTSQNIILVVSTQKITPTLSAALRRLEEHVIPLEDTRLMGVHGIHTTHAKTLILHKENPSLGRNISVILVKEKLGF